MIDPLDDFAERSRRMHSLTRAFELACNQAIDSLTPQQERDRPHTRLELFRKRKVARELLLEFEKLDIDRLVADIKQRRARIDIEGKEQ